MEGQLLRSVTETIILINNQSGNLKIEDYGDKRQISTDIVEINYSEDLKEIDLYRKKNLNPVLCVRNGEIIRVNGEAIYLLGELQRLLNVLSIIKEDSLWVKHNKQFDQMIKIE